MKPKTLTLAAVCIFAYCLLLTAYCSAQGTWTQKLNFGGTAREAAVCFSIGTKAYTGTGSDGVAKNDFWEYDPTSNAWTQKANFGARQGAVGFSIGTKGYAGTGHDGNAYKQEFWEYDPIGNTWAQKANFGGTARNFSVGFSIGNNGYIGTGTDGAVQSDFWEYSPSVTSMNELNSVNLVSVYPNPFFIQTTISLSQEVNDASLIIYDLSGKEVKNINFSGKQVVMERENLFSGIYFYRIVLKEKTISKGKIIIH